MSGIKATPRDEENGLAITPSGYVRLFGLWTMAMTFVATIREKGNAVLKTGRRVSLYIDRVLREINREILQGHRTLTAAMWLVEQRNLEDAFVDHNQQFVNSPAGGASSASSPGEPYPKRQKKTPRFQQASTSSTVRSTRSAPGPRSSGKTNYCYVWAASTLKKKGAKKCPHGTGCKYVMLFKPTPIASAHMSSRCDSFRHFFKTDKEREQAVKRLAK